MNKILCVLCFLWLCLSCTKETSDENGNGNNTNPPVGNNCRVNQVTSLDSLTGVGLYSIYTRFGSNGQANLIRVFDSTVNALQFETAIRYSGDTAWVGPAQYFLLDAGKRVRAFRSIESSGSGIDTITMRYNYDAAGYMTSKDIFIGSLPLPVFRFSYTWQGGNLTRVTGGAVVPGLEQKVLEATVEFDDATAKNFIPVFPDGFETSLFVMALDFGKPSRNLPRKMTVILYDDAGKPDATYVTNYKNFVFSSDGYLLEWYAQGEEAGGTPFPSGRTRFGYFCP